MDEVLHKEKLLKLMNPHKLLLLKANAAIWIVLETTSDESKAVIWR